MTEEQKDRMDVEEDVAQEEAMPVEAEEGTTAEEPAKGRTTGWTVLVAAVAAVLVLCTMAVCVAAAIAAFSGGEEETAAPGPTIVPAPTRAPSGAMIAITEPDQGQVVDIGQPVQVSGKGVGLTEGNVVVEALDWQGNVLDRQPATLQGPEVATGGEGTWSTELTVEVEPGTAGKIRAYHPSALDGSIVAEDVVEVSLGRTAAVQPYIRIEEPTQGAVLDIAGPVGVRGTGAGLTEANVVVEALDWQGNVLDRQPATLQGPDVGTGGEGTWSTELTIGVELGTAGRIRAYHPSALDGSIVAEDVVEVSLGRTAPMPLYIFIDEPSQGAVLDISGPIGVRGRASGLTEANVVVEALDWQGNVLDRQPATLQGPDMGPGTEGTWSTELTIEVEPGTAGRIWAYHRSPLDGSIIAEDSVEVSLGQTPAVQSYIKIDAPSQGTTLDVSKPVQVSGTGAGLPEGNVVVVALDQNGDVLAEQPTTLQGPDVDTGGAGTWSVELAVPASGQKPGYIAAFSASPKQRGFVASDHVEVTFSGAYTLEGTTWLLDKTIPGSEITALFDKGVVSGSAGCNSYSTSYVTTPAAGKNTIRIEEPMAMTMMMCDEPLMDQEQLYVSALASATEYTVEGFALTISYPGGTLLFYDKYGPRPRR